MLHEINSVLNRSSEACSLPFFEESDKGQCQSDTGLDQSHDSVSKTREMQMSTTGEYDTLCRMSPLRRTDLQRFPRQERT